MSSHMRHNASVSERRSVDKAAPMLISLKRLVSDDDAVLLSSLALAASVDCQFTPKLPSESYRGSSLLTQGEGARIFKVATRAVRPLSSQHFNGIVEEHADTVNRQREAVEARLGTVCRFTVLHGIAMRQFTYIGITLEGDAVAVVPQERKDLLLRFQEVTGQSPLDDVRVPHISVGSTSSQPAAGLYAESLQRRLSHLQEEVGPLDVTLGPAVPLPFEVHRPRPSL